MHYIIEGVDRLGKDTLIKNIQHEKGYHLVQHYQKPELLDTYSELHNKKSDALKAYQYDSFYYGFELMTEHIPTIFNRFHLGEYVYAPRYRGYKGDYIFDIEREQGIGLPINDFHNKQIRLILLTTSDFSFIKDDGQSFDFDKKEEEQEDFINAFYRSVIPNKIMIDVSNGKGGYRDANEILEEAMYKDLYQGIWRDS